jgi:hypothetical protein
MVAGNRWHEQGPGRRSHSRAVASTPSYAVLISTAVTSQTKQLMQAAEKSLQHNDRCGLDNVFCVVVKRLLCCRGWLSGQGGHPGLPGNGVKKKELTAKLSRRKNNLA